MFFCCLVCIYMPAIDRSIYLSWFVYTCRRLIDLSLSLIADGKQIATWKNSLGDFVAFPIVFLKSCCWCEFRLISVGFHWNFVDFPSFFSLKSCNFVDFPSFFSLKSCKIQPVRTIWAECSGSTRAGVCCMLHAGKEILLCMYMLAIDM